MTVEINKQAFTSFLLYSSSFKYNNFITLYPIKMKNIILFNRNVPAFVLRKNSIFCDKRLIKMDYWDFIKYAYKNYDLATQYKMPILIVYYEFIISMLSLACGSDAKIEYNPETLDVFINEQLITNEIFDDLRRIIILQNDIDFDVDEFMNIDTINTLEKARAFETRKIGEKIEIEDYIDSMIVDLKITEDRVSNMSIRKFWRYIKRIQKHEEYQTCRSAELTGFVKFNTPLSHWMTSFEVKDKYSAYKADENDVRSKIH